MTVEEYRFEILATLRFQSTFSTEDIDGMTWGECERFCEFHRMTERDRIEAHSKLFAYRNLESTRLAYHGQPADLEKYLKELRGADKPEENDIDAQFEGVDFGK
jgi:hypothetical protein